MASPSLNPLQSGGQPPPSTAPAPVIVPMNGPGSSSRPGSEPRSARSASEIRAPQPALQSPATQSPAIQTQSPALARASPSTQAPTPVNGQIPQKPNGEVKAVMGTNSYVDLAKLIKTAPLEVVRQVIRDHWQRCLIGSDFHVGFILNTTLHHASPHLLDQAVQDFGAKLATSSKHKWVQHLTSTDVDELADALLKRASDSFLDRALARRLETISGRNLVNALARADRLGYDTRDIVGEKDSSKPEHVIPSMHSSAPAGYPANDVSTGQYPQQAPSSEQRAPPPPEFPIVHPTDAQKAIAYPLGIVFCKTCGRPCSGANALDNHDKKRACSNHVTKLERMSTDTCIHCGVVFQSTGGLAYHQKSAVCGVYTENVRTIVHDLIAQRAKVPAIKAFRPTPSQVPQPPYQAPSQPSYAKPSSSARQDLTDSYNAMSPEVQRQFDAEMKNAEEMYGGQMRQAMTLDPVEAEIELAKIKNRLNSRQSNLRRKYGIKLRDRRTRAQIDADNARIANNSPVATPPPSSASAQRPMNGSVKRPLSVQSESPRKRVPLSEMSGLTGAAASAEMTDPTLNMGSDSAQPRPPVQASRDVPMMGTGEPITIDSDPSGSESGSDGPTGSVGGAASDGESRRGSTGGA